MLVQPTLDLLASLGLHGMSKAFQDLEVQPEAKALQHAEWLALLLEREVTLRRQKRFEARARAARLRQQASVEDVDFRAARGLDRGLFLELASCAWVRARHGLLLTGPTGVGGTPLTVDQFRATAAAVGGAVAWPLEEGWDEPPAGRPCRCSARETRIPFRHPP